MRNLSIVLLVVVSAIMSAMSLPAMSAEFQADAQTLLPEQIKERLSGKTYKSVTTAGQPLKVQYKDTGYAFLDVATGYRDTGKWWAEGSKLCTQWQKTPNSGCFEMRLQGTTLMLQRANGDIVPLTEN